MSDWLSLRSLPKSITKADSKLVRPGVRFEVDVSPYDVPNAVRGFMTSHGRFRIEFRYIDGSEPPQQEKKLDAFVSVFEGRHSRRLLAIEVDVRALGAESVGLSITPQERFRRHLDAAWPKVEAQHSAPDERGHVEGAREAIDSRARDLFLNLV